VRDLLAAAKAIIFACEIGSIGCGDEFDVLQHENKLLSLHYTFFFTAAPSLHSYVHAHTVVAILAIDGRHLTRTQNNSGRSETRNTMFMNSLRRGLADIVRMGVTSGYGKRWNSFRRYHAHCRASANVEVQMEVSMSEGDFGAPEAKLRASSALWLSKCPSSEIQSTNFSRKASPLICVRS
jgi:hypothetical protein